MIVKVIVLDIFWYAHNLLTSEMLLTIQQSHGSLMISQNWKIRSFSWDFAICRNMFWTAYDTWFTKKWQHVHFRILCFWNSKTIAYVASCREWNSPFLKICFKTYTVDVLQMENISLVGKLSRRTTLWETFCFAFNGFVCSLCPN